MKPDLFLKNFQLLGDAPGGIPKLRELILQLAVQGKLVEQDPKDEPVAVLLEKIEAEKDRLVKEGKIRKSEPLPPVKPDDIPFTLPTGWEWVRFGDVIVNRDGERIPVSRAERQHRQGLYDYYGASGVIDKIDDYLFNKPLLLIGEDGANLINRSTPIAFIARGKYWVNNHAHVLDAYCMDLLNFLALHINAIDLEPYVTGTAQPKMNQEKMNGILIGLPPLAEQRRIVAKVDQLMARCDELEALQKKRNEARITLTASCLNQLTSTEPATARPAWRRVSDNFDMLLDTPESVATLRKTILQLAVQGKLVEQDPKDEPASLLLKKLEARKEQLIKEGKVKKQNPLPNNNSGEAPHELPTGWAWVKLNEVLDVRDGTHDSPKDAYGPNTFPLVTSKDFCDGVINFDGARRISAEDHAEISKRSFVEMGDILFSMIGGNLGNQVMVDNDRPFSIKNVALFKHYDKNLISPFFIKTFTEHLAIGLQSHAVGGAQPFVSLGFLRNLSIGIPPTEEQKRIVAKVDQLMKLCDALEAKLAQSQADADKLISAIVHSLIGTAV